MKTVPTALNRRPLLAWLAGQLLLAAPLAEAHGPPRQKALETVLIDAPPARVWALIRDFSALKDWHPAIAESPADQGNTPGSVRTLKLRNGATLAETLDAWDDAKMRYTYRVKDGLPALPVSNYASTISVSDQGGRTLVEWRGGFYRGHPNNDPPPELNDEAAVAAVSGVYRSGLDHLKKLAEGR